MPASRVEHRLVPIADDEDARATARALEASDRTDGDIAVLAGEGTHAPVATRRAAELVAAQDGSLTLLNVQPPTDDEASPTERSEALIDDLVERAGIETVGFETRVMVAEDTEQAISGSRPEQIGTRVDGTVVIARGPEESPMSIREAISRRLEV